jgi:hypothetical protein
MDGSSYTDLDSLEPIAGDLIVALVGIRSWENEQHRGVDGLYIEKGQQALVLSTWMVGNQCRIKVLRDNRILVFSHPDHCVRKNWKVAVPVPRLPTLGCP